MENKRELKGFLEKWLPKTYGEMLRDEINMTNKERLASTLVKLICDGGNMKAINIALDRLVGKVEKAIIIRKVTVRQLYVDATQRELEAKEKMVIDERPDIIEYKDNNDIILNKEETPSFLLEKELEFVGDADKQYIGEILDNKEIYSVARVMSTSLYSQAIISNNIEAIRVLFDRIDGAVADVVNIYDDSLIVVPNYSKKAPMDTKQDSSGTFYIDMC